MKKINVLVADGDREYATALGEMLANKFDDFHISVVSPPSVWSPEEKAKAAEYDVILCDGKENREGKGEAYLFLSESGTEEQSVDRFAGAAAIAAEILTHCRGKGGGRGLSGSRKETPFYVFTSGAGGVGKTVVALAAARELSVFHRKKTLYLSFEEPGSGVVYFKGEGGKRSINNYLYYLFSNIERQNDVSPDAFLSTDRWGVDSFCAAIGRNELRDLTEEQFRRLFAALCDARNYQAVCIDFPYEDSDFFRSLYADAAAVVLLCDGSPVSQSKNGSIRRMLSSWEQGHRKTRLLQVRNKWKEDAENNGGSEEDLSIDFDPASFRIEGDRIVIETDRSFGVGVKKLADEIGRAL